MGAKPSEFAWRARKGADGGTGQGVGSLAVRGRADVAGATGGRLGQHGARGGGQPGGTRARWACGRCGRASATGGRLGRPSGTRVRWARGRAGGQSASPPAQFARTTQIPPSASDSPQTPSGRMPSHPRHTPARTRLPDAHSASQRVPPPRGGCVRLPSAHPPLEASPAPWRAPGERPTPGASGSQQTPSGRMPCHPRRAPGFPASTPGVRLAPSRRLPGARPAIPGAHPAQRAPTHRSAPGSLARTWRAPAPRLSGHSRHGLRSLGPSGTRFWPFLPCFTSKQAFAMRKT